MATITVKEADGPGTLTDIDIPPLGRAAAASSKPIAISTEDKTVLDAVSTAVTALATAIASARMAVNVVPGQVGVAAGSGAANALTQRVISATDDPIIAAINTGASASIPAGIAMIGHVGGTDYETVAASASDQILGTTGAIGDALAGLLVVPATTSPGAVQIKDGSGSLITLFAGGATSVSNLVPFFVGFGGKCTGVGWKVTTGTNVSVLAVGDFT